MAAGVVHIPWYATVFRGDKLAAALAEIAPVAMRYGASHYLVYRNRDDMYKFLQTSTFEDKGQFEAYWNGPEFVDFRTIYSSCYQVPVLYTWADLVVQGALNGTGNGLATATNGAPAEGDTF